MMGVSFRGRGSTVAVAATNSAPNQQIKMLTGVNASGFRKPQRP
jgi:hypothetical protein